MDIIKEMKQLIQNFLYKAFQSKLSKCLNRKMIEAHFSSFQGENIKQKFTKTQVLTRKFINISKLKESNNNK